MFSKGKDGTLGSEQDAALRAMKAAEPGSRPAAAAAAAPPPEAASSISAGMTVVGKLVGDGAITIYGRVEGELQASTVLICEGAQVEGNIVAKELTVGGRLKGTIHAVRVKLQGTAIVEGDIFHRSLAIEENARFEGTSRREDNLSDKPSVVPARGLSAAAVAQPQIGLIDSNGRFKESDDKDFRSAG